MSDKEELYMIRCEKVVNETWSKLDNYYDELKEILDSGGPKNEREQAIVLLAAETALHNLTLTNAQDEYYFNPPIALPPCGDESKECCNCELVENCDFIEDPTF